MRKLKIIYMLRITIVCIYIYISHITKHIYIQYIFRQWRKFTGNEMQQLASCHVVYKNNILWPHAFVHWQVSFLMLWISKYGKYGQGSLGIRLKYSLSQSGWVDSRTGNTASGRELFLFLIALFIFQSNQNVGILNKIKRISIY